jgi:hypothetical protein
MSTTITENEPPAASAATSLDSSDQHKYDYARLPEYIHPPETKEKLPWAELVTLDLADFEREGGNERLAKQLEHAAHNVGFFYVKNYGLSQDEVNNQFTLAKSFFELPIEEKAKYEVDYAAADYNGWRRNGLRKQGSTVDNVEMYK